MCSKAWSQCRETDFLLQCPRYAYVTLIKHHNKKYLKGERIYLVYNSKLGSLIGGKSGQEHKAIKHIYVEQQRKKCMHVRIQLTVSFSFNLGPAHGILLYIFRMDFPTLIIPNKKILLRHAHTPIPHWLIKTPYCSNSTLYQVDGINCHSLSASCSSTALIKHQKKKTIQKKEFILFMV